MYWINYPTDEICDCNRRCSCCGRLKRPWHHVHYPPYAGSGVYTDTTKTSGDYICLNLHEY